MNDRRSPIKPSSSTANDSREALVRAATRVFAERGFDGATVKDVADHAGVNISLVSYHFGGKEGLYRTCLENFGIERLEAAERILKAPSSSEEFKLRLRLFAEGLVDIHLRDADSCAMIHRAMGTQDPITSEVFKNVFMRVFEALKHFVGSAQSKGIVRPDLDVEVSTGMMFGGLMHLLTAQNLMRKLGRRTIDDPAYVTLAIDQWILVNTEGFFPRAEAK
jgi:AcrR family transcriptional regulator